MIFEDIKNYLFSVKPLLTLGTIAFGLVFWHFFKRLMNRRFEKMDHRPVLQQYSRTLMTIIKAVCFFILFIAVLQVNGVQVSSLVAGLGITSIIVGYGLQDVINDWLMGLFIIFENFFMVGDYIQVDDVVGQVQKISLKCTKILDINNGAVVTINNRHLQKVAVISDFVLLSVPIPYDLTVKAMNDLLAAIEKGLKALDRVADVKMMGIQEFGDSQIPYRVKLFLHDKNDGPQARRDALTLIHRIFEEHQVEIPYNQLDVHIKNDGQEN
ncbi:MAG: mechanosensitive ion channel family protein [Lachnospiraceae bacterium]|nr:mechanosensitive ion channel family protein [Lachnospiraceae bacterium]